MNELVEQLLNLNAISISMSISEGLREGRGEGRRKPVTVNLEFCFKIMSTFDFCNIDIVKLSFYQ